MVNEERAYKRTANCTNVVDLRNVRNYKTRYKWEKKIRNI